LLIAQVSGKVIKEESIIFHFSLSFCCFLYKI
jgi:hypothetical protein